MSLYFNVTLIYFPVVHGLVFADDKLVLCLPGGSVSLLHCDLDFLMLTLFYCHHKYSIDIWGFTLDKPCGSWSALYSGLTA